MDLGHKYIHNCKYHQRFLNRIRPTQRQVSRTYIGGYLDENKMLSEIEDGRHTQYTFPAGVLIPTLNILDYWYRAKVHVCLHIVLFVL